MTMSLKRELKLGLIVLLGMAVVACAIPRGLPTGSYPVRATLEATVEGHPIKATRVFRCEEYIVTHYGCPGCIRWRSTLDRIAEPLPSGGVLLAKTNVVCLETGPMAPGKHTLHSIGWADSLERPNRVELYETEAPAVSDIYAKNPKILVRSLRFSLERITEHDAEQSDTNAEKKAGWFTFGGSDQETSGFSEYRRLAAFGASAIPRRIWSQIPWLAAEIEKVATAIMIEIPPDKEKEFSALLNKAWDQFKKGDADVPIPLRIPGKYMGGNNWVLDEENAGIEILYYVGMAPTLKGYSREGPSKIRDHYQRWLDSQEMKIDSGKYLTRKNQRKYIFVPEKSEMLSIGWFRTMADFSKVE